MTDRHDELERQISERRDGSTGQDEIERLMAENPEAARLDRAYARLDQLLADWRQLPANMNWSSLRSRLSRSIADFAEFQITESADETGHRAEIARGASGDAARGAPADAAMDRTIRNAAGPMPEIDWNASRTRFSAAIRDEAARLSVAGRTIRLRPVRGDGLGRFASPLAAAAAIAITAVVWFRPIQHNPGEIVVAPPKAYVGVEIGEPIRSDRIRVNVEFDRSPSPVAASTEERTRGAALAIGSRLDDVMVAMDDALFQ